MKKANILGKDRSTNFDYYLNRSILPDHIEQGTGDEVIELDTSDSSESIDETRNLDRKHAWCYVDRNQLQMDKDIFKISKKARERRRMRNRVCPGSVNTECLSYENVDESDHVYAGFYSHRFNNEPKQRTFPNNPINCFTVIQNEFADSETSSDKENGGEIIKCGDVVLERNYWNNNAIYSTNRKKCDADLDNSKRTIWIYSFRNKNILCEDVCKSVDLFSDDDSSSSSVENFDYGTVKNKTEQEYRVPTPTAATYKPRLNVFVAATLPTVTEIAEPYQFTSSNVENITSVSNKPVLHEPSKARLEVTKRQSNSSQFPTKNQEDKSLSNQRNPTAHCVINWMALSPREKRRYRKIPNLIEENRYDKLEKDNQNNIIVNSTNKLVKNVGDSISDLAGTTDQKLPQTEHDITYVKTKEETKSQAISIKKINDQYPIDEKGDYNKFKRIKKPKLRLGHLIMKKIISDPIEKLDGDGWIGNEVVNKQEPVFNIDVKEAEEVYEEPKAISRCAGDRLLSKNMSLLKPVEWSEYLPITESIPSLHLSFHSDMNEPWFKRFLKCIICCKSLNK